MEAAREKVLKYVEELMKDGAFDFCSDEECEEIREKFERLVRAI